MEQNASIHNVMPQHILDKINARYYGVIPKLVDFEHIIKNPEIFSSAIRKNTAFYSDHGFNHAVNVASQVPIILNAISGIHIPKRDKKRHDFICNYGILLGCIHDIGMSDVSIFGREMHGEFVAQEMFAPNFKSIFNAMWDENVGNIPWTLLFMRNEGIIQEPPELVFRELLSLSCCHRKLLVPVKILNDPAYLRKQMQYFVGNNLHYQYYGKEIEAAEHTLNQAKKKAVSEHEIEKHVHQLKMAQKNLQEISSDEDANKKLHAQLAQYYENFANDSFKWLLNENIKAQKFICDIIDTLRVLRCADALRQRGTDLKTSAEYQIFVSQFTANAIFALTSKKRKMYFLELSDKISCGEANVASLVFTKEGDLRFEFHRGFFHSKTAIDHALSSLIQIIAQLDYDICDTFIRPKADVENFTPLKRPKLLLETTDDNPNFTNDLATGLIAIKPNLKDTIEIVPSLHNISYDEYQYYINGKKVDWTVNKVKAFLKRIAKFGYKIAHIDVHKAFANTRIIEIKAGYTLFEAKTSSGFVYFPLNNGLEGLPTRSYSLFTVAPFTPLGSTGVVRGDIRNATIVAKNRVKLLAIPKDDYLSYWHATYTAEEFGELIKKGLIK